jgi:hypothetical protein
VSARLKTGLYVRVLIRRAEIGGASVYVARRGAEEAGALILKLTKPNGSLTVLSRASRGDGERVWIKPLGDSADSAAATKYFEKQVRFDPDLWIVEIEDREGRAFVDEPIV